MFWSLLYKCPRLRTVILNFKNNFKQIDIDFVSCHINPKRQHVTLPQRICTVCFLIQIYAAVYNSSWCSLEASLKFKLASETSKVASQRDRIQQLQNELIKVRNNTIHTAQKWNNPWQFSLLLCFLSVLCRKMTARRSCWNFRESTGNRSNYSNTRITRQRWPVWRPQWNSRKRWTLQHQWFHSR